MICLPTFLWLLARHWWSQFLYSRQRGKRFDLNNYSDVNIMSTIYIYMYIYTFIHIYIYIYIVSMLVMGHIHVHWRLWNYTYVLSIFWWSSHIKRLVRSHAGHSEKQTTGHAGNARPMEDREHTYYKAIHWYSVVTWDIMTSSNTNIFRVTGPLWGESTGHRWIPHTKASDEELWCFIWSASEQTVEKKQQLRRRWFETPSRSLWRHPNEPLRLQHQNS